MNSVATISKISATSRASVKIKDSFYTVEYSEERLLPTDIEFNIADERKLLWNNVNKEVDDQIAEILETFK